MSFHPYMIRRVLQCTPKGSRNAKDRYRIADQIGINERVYRDYVEHINANGIAIIIAGVRGRGYFIPEFPEDRPYYEAYLAKERSKARKINEKCDGMEGKKGRRIFSMEPIQLNLFDEGWL